MSPPWGLNVSILTIDISRLTIDDSRDIISFSLFAWLLSCSIRMCTSRSKHHFSLIRSPYHPLTHMLEEHRVLITLHRMSQSSIKRSPPFIRLTPSHGMIGTHR